MSPVPVSAVAPGSRPRFVIERWRAKRASRASRCCGSRRLATSSLCAGLDVGARYLHLNAATRVIAEGRKRRSVSQHLDLAVVAHCVDVDPQNVADSSRDPEGGRFCTGRAHDRKLVLGSPISCRDGVESAASRRGAASSGLVIALEAVWAEIRRRHPDVPVVIVTVTVGAGSIGASPGTLRLGHYAAARWRPATDRPRRSRTVHRRRSLALGAVDVLGTLLHQAAHGVAFTRAIKRTPAAAGRITTPASSSWGRSSACRSTVTP